MLNHSELPTYYIGLNEGNTRSRRPTNIIAFPLVREITKIPFAQDPHEFNDKYLLSFNVEGVNAQDIAVALEGRTLHIEVEKEFNPFKVTHTNWGKAWGIFLRKMELPMDANDKRIFYSVYKGTLTIEVYKDLAVTENLSSKILDLENPNPTIAP